MQPWNLISSRIPIVFARGIEYRALIAATSELVSRQAVEPADVPGRSLVGANTRVVFDACVRVNKHRRAVNRACATRRIVIDKQPLPALKKRLRRVHTLSGVMKYRWVFDSYSLLRDCQLASISGSRCATLVFQFTPYFRSVRKIICLSLTWSECCSFEHLWKLLYFCESRFNWFTKRNFNRETTLKTRNYIFLSLSKFVSVPRHLIRHFSKATCTRGTSFPLTKDAPPAVYCESLGRIKLIIQERFVEATITRGRKMLPLTIISL